MAELAGPSTDALTDLAKFNYEVERVAKLMCEELGLNPNEVVSVPRERALTPLELKTCLGNPEAKAFWTQVMPTSRWESYRRQAAISLAAFRAVNKYILTEA